jgi:hypothetical protein
MNSHRRSRVSVAGLRVEFESRLDDFEFHLPDHYRAFESKSEEFDLRVRVDSLRPAASGSDSFVFRCPTWAVRRRHGRTVFETYHPFFSRVIANAEADRDFQEYDLVYNTEFLNWFCTRHLLPRNECLTLGYPLGQLMLIPTLARHQSFLVHACGAVISGRAFVFAGHSGDGKTTLSKMLAREGVELLSDERVAIRKQGGQIMAYGTPWPGEGHVVSPASYPLGGVFLLRKAQRHRIEERSSSTVAAELLSRSIVPYYLPDETARIVNLLAETVATVPCGELEFALSSGLVTTLSRLIEPG